MPSRRRLFGLLLVKGRAIENLESLEAVAPVCAHEELPVLGGRENGHAVAAAANGGCGDVGYVSRARAFEGAEAPLATWIPENLPLAFAVDAIVRKASWNSAVIPTP